MKVIKSYETGEFWGARYCEPTYEIEEEYQGEMKDWVLEQVMEAGADKIPTYRTIESEYGDFEIKVKDYLTKDDVKEIEKYIEAVEKQYNEVLGV